MRSANNDMQNTIRLARRYWRITILQAALAQPFHCDLHRLNCKQQKHSVNKEKKKWPGTLSSTARADRTGMDGKAATPATVAHASQLFSAGNLRWPENTQCFAQILTFKSHPWCSSSNAICQQWHAKHNQNRNFSALLFSSLLCSTSTPTLLLLYLCL